MADSTIRPAADGTFRVLVVCTGNVCRSALAERVIRSRFGAALGPTMAARFAVTSAGTEAVLGAAMDPRAAAVARSLGADPDDFTARQLTADLVVAADLVLTATRQHRAAVVRLCPSAHRYTFTVLEFARLVGAIPAADGPAAADPVERAGALVAAVRARRGRVRAEQSEDDDIPDPRGTVSRVHQTVGAAIFTALAEPLAVICGSPCTGTEPVPGAQRSRRTRWWRLRRSLVRPRWHVAVLAGLLLFGAAAGWLALRGMQAQGELTTARADLEAVRAALLAGEPDRAHAALADAQRRTGRAHRLTDDPVWRAAAATPYLGGAPRAVRTVAAAVDGITERALPALVDAGAVVAPDRLRPRGDRVEVAGFARARPAIETAKVEVAGARRRLDELDGWLPRPVAVAVDGVSADLARTAATLDGVDRAARLVPAMLGADRPRRYLLVFQNNAEARGTGGLPGMYAVLTAAGGQIRVERLGSNTDLHGADRLPVDLGPAYTAQWGQDPALWANSNLDPSFPNAARIWLALWQRQTGQHLDGAIATDPVAAGYVLAATGAVRLPDGEQVDATNVVPLTMSRVYARFAQGEPQNAYLRVVARSVVGALLSGRGEPQALLAGLGRAAQERRLLVYSADPAEQADLVAASLGGTLPDGAGPYAFVVVNNVAGSKMDYYLRRSLSYAGGGCAGGERDSRITISFGNASPAAERLPGYVTQRQDAGAGSRTRPAPPGWMVLQVSVYGPRDAGVTRSTLEGRSMPISSLVVAGRPVWGFPLVVPPGRWRTVVLDVREPTSAALPTVPVQPLVQPQRVEASVAGCG